MGNLAEFDVGPLTWVKSEIDEALKRSLAALHAHVHHPQDPAHLKQCLAQFHQAHGALQIVGLDGVAKVSEELEGLIGDIRTSNRPADLAGIAERAIGGISTYLEQLLAGELNQPLKLFSIYRVLTLARGKPEPDPVDLYFPDLTGRAPKREGAPAALSPAARAALVRDERGRFQRGFLRWIKKDLGGVRDMHAAIAAIEASEHVASIRSFWWAAAALLDAVGSAGAPDGPAVQRLCNRIERQMKRMIDGGANVAERLMREVLFLVAQAPAATPQLRDVQHVFGLAGSVPEKFELTIENAAQLPRVRALREGVTAAKTSWTKFVSGHVPTATAFTEQAVLLRDHSATLGRWELSKLAEEMVGVVDGLADSRANVNEPLALEMATALLLFEDAVEKFNALPAEFSKQCHAMIARLRRHRGDQSLTPMPSGAVLEEISRRAQERMALAQLVAEIQVNLRAVENSLDSYFRNPSTREALKSLDKPVGQVIGAFRMLNEAKAEAALTECAMLIRRFADPLFEPKEFEFEYVAGVLSGLGFYVEALQHGKADFDAAMRPIRAAREAWAEQSASRPIAPTVEAQLEEQRRKTAPILAAWRAKPEDPVLKDALRGNIEAIQHDAALVADSATETSARDALRALERTNASPADAALRKAIARIAPGIEPVAEPSAATAKLAESSPEAIDAELLDVYLTEAVDVLASIHEHLVQARATANNLEILRPIRRGFHTLKGSGRMVGLTRLAEAAWAVERLLNAWLEAEPPANEELLTLIGAAERFFTEAIIALKNGQPVPDERRIVEMAGAVRIEEPMVSVGDRRMSPALFNIFVNESRSHIERIRQEQAGLDATGAVSDDYLRAAHTLAGIAGTVSLGALRELAAAIEHAGNVAAKPVDIAARGVFGAAVDGLARMAQAVIDRKEPLAEPALLARLGALADGSSLAAEAQAIDALPELTLPELATADSTSSAPEPRATDTTEVALPALDSLASDEAPVIPRPASAAPTPVEAAAPTPVEAAAPIADVIDAQLLPLFLEEAEELIPAAGATLREWREHPMRAESGQALQRALHTLKGSARMTGLHAYGQMFHEMETRVENALAQPVLPAKLFEDLENRYDAIGARYDALIAPADEPIVSAESTAIEAEQREAQLIATPIEPEVAATPAPVTSAPLPAAIDEPLGEAEPAFAAAEAVSSTVEPLATLRLNTGAAPPTQEADRVALLRVRADMIDRLVNQAGEVAIARSRVEGEVKVLKGALVELTANVERLRSQLREIEIQAESQIQSRQMHAPNDRDRSFDPLEFDRFTRFQELTRMMAESVNDVATVHNNIQRAIDEAETSLSSQARISRDLQQDLLKIRMMPFASVAERLYRIVRQAAKDAGRRAVLDIRGGQVELDRSVLERITAPFEHMLRNAVGHGLEPPEARRAAGKPDVGSITVEVQQEGNEVMLTVSDDGAGLDLQKIRAKALQAGLIQPADELEDNDLADLIFQPGFTTAEKVTHLAGRGVGMDVVKSEIASLGGRVEVHTEAGKGTKFVLYLPLTLAVTHAVIVRAGPQKYVIPSVMVEQIQQASADDLAELYRSRIATWQGRRGPFYYLPRLLGDGVTQHEAHRTNTVIFVRSGSSAVALHVDEMLGNQEIVVKNTGPLLARLAGITGATVLGSGEILLIINPVVLASREMVAMQAALARPTVRSVEPDKPGVMIVDDSLTVRKITGRLLAREGYAVLTARDGVDALEQLADGPLPIALLVDIEMPRMDGFEFTRKVRADARLKHLPIIIISSRTAQKHRAVAKELGVDHFLGKPYRDDELVGLLADYAKAGAASA